MAKNAAGAAFFCVLKCPVRYFGALIGFRVYRCTGPSTKKIWKKVENYVKLNFKLSFIAKLNSI